MYIFNYTLMQLVINLNNFCVFCNVHLTISWKVVQYKFILLVIKVIIIIIIIIINNNNC